jgi:hypothetical protein
VISALVPIIAAEQLCANAMTDSVSIKELKEISAPEGMIALRPKMEAATKRCLTN